MNEAVETAHIGVALGVIPQSRSMIRCRVDALRPSRLATSATGTSFAANTATASWVRGSAAPRTREVRKAHSTAAAAPEGGPFLRPGIRDVRQRLRIRLHVPGRERDAGRGQRTAGVLPRPGGRSRGLLAVLPGSFGDGSAVAGRPVRRLSGTERRRRRGQSRLPRSNAATCAASGARRPWGWRPSGCCCSSASTLWRSSRCRQRLCWCPSSSWPRR